MLPYHLLTLEAHEEFLQENLTKHIKAVRKYVDQGYELELLRLVNKFNIRWCYEYVATMICTTGDSDGSEYEIYISSPKSKYFHILR